MLNISFYDGIKYHRTDFINRDKDFFGNGVVNASHFPYTIGSGLTLQIGAGAAWVDGYRIENDASAISLTLDAANATNPRIDIIEIGHDDINSQPVLKVKKGTAAATPIEPDADPSYIKLFAITVPANATTLVAGNVADKRQLVPLNVSGTQINMSGAAGIGQKNTFTDTQTFSNGNAPINIPNLTSLPAIQPSNTLIVVNSVWYRSDGTNWIPLSANFYAANTSATDDYAIAVSGISAYTAGMVVSFKATIANTTGCTLNINGLGAKNIYKNVSTALETGDIIANQMVEVIYDGTNFQLISAPGSVTTAQSSQTLSNKTLTAPKIANGGFIADPSGNEQIVFTQTTGAVNNIGVKNSATGAGPEVQAVGADTNIDLNLTPKGTGSVKTVAPVSASKFTSTVATGTAPFSVSSTTKVASLNVEQVDGYDANATPTANTIPVLDANAKLPVAALPAGTTTAAGALQLTDSVSSTSTTTAATPNSVKTAYDLANGAIPSTQKGSINGVASLDAAGDVPTTQLPAGSTTAAGILQLTDSTSSTSTTTAATPKNVKTAYDLANAAIPSTQKGVANGVASLDTNGDVPVAQLPSGSTTATGVLQLTDSVSSTSTTTAATPKNVKTAYDLANAAIPSTQKGVASGVATLDANGDVPASQLGNVPPSNLLTMPIYYVG